MFTKITRKYPLDFLSVTEAKDHLNIIDNTDDDNYIRTLVDVAQEMVEIGTNRLLSLSTVTVECSYRNTRFLLPYGEISAITSCQLDGEDIGFKFSEVKQQILLDNIPMPDSDIQIVYDAGYINVPKSLKAAAMIMVSNMYEYREDAVDSSLQSAPMASKTLMGAFKLPLVAL